MLSGLKITVETNVIVSAVAPDDIVQAEAAGAVLRDAEMIAVSLVCLC